MFVSITLDHGKPPGEWHREGGGRRVDGMRRVNGQEPKIKHNRSTLPGLRILKVQLYYEMNRNPQQEDHGGSHGPASLLKESRSMVKKL